MDGTSLANWFQRAFEAKQNEMQTCMPAIVEAFDKDKQTVDVLPQLNFYLPDGAGNFIAQKITKLLSVKVVFQRAGVMFASFPIAKGDYVLLVFAQRSLANWRGSGAQSNPGDLAMHTLDGAVAIPGLYPDADSLDNVSAENLVIGSDTHAGSRIVITPADGIELGEGADDGVLTKKDFRSFLKAWSDAAAIAMDGGVGMRTATLLTLATQDPDFSPGPSVENLGSSEIKALR